MNNIILIGFMGSGKTSVGKRLAKRRKAVFLDTDQMIEEKYQTTIADIFNKHGESYFRLLETAMLEQILTMNPPIVLSVGGGLAVQPENFEYLKKIGKIFYLRSSKETLIKRLKNDKTRPLLQGGSLEDKISELMAKRENIYEEIADTAIDTDGLSFKKIMDKIERGGEIEDSGNQWA